MRTLQDNNNNNNEELFYPTDIHKLCLYLAKQGHAILAKEAKETPIEIVKPCQKQKPIAIIPKEQEHTNPYIRAHIEVLASMSKFNRDEIIKMEKEGNIENRFYEEFAKQVRIIADTKYPSA